MMTGTRIGKSCNIGQNVVISPEVVIGNDVKIHNNVSVYTGVVLEDDVFCGPPWSYQRFQSSEPWSRKHEYKRLLSGEALPSAPIRLLSAAIMSAVSRSSAPS